VVKFCLGDLDRGESIVWLTDGRSREIYIDPWEEGRECGADVQVHDSPATQITVNVPVQLAEEWVT